MPPQEKRVKESLYKKKQEKSKRRERSNHDDDGEARVSKVLTVPDQSKQSRDPLHPPPHHHTMT